MGFNSAFKGLNSAIKVCAMPEQTLVVQWVKSSNLLTKTDYPEGSLCSPGFLQATT